MQESYLRAVWRCGWNNFATWLKDTRKLLVNGIVGIVATVIAMQFVKPTDLLEKVGIATVSLLASLLILFLLNLLWSWATAPRSAYLELQAAVASHIANESVLQEQLADMREELEEARSPSPQPLAQLKIEFEKINNFTQHPNGSIQVKCLIRNRGTVNAKRVRVRIEAIVPKKKIAASAPFTSQYPAIRLQVTREKLGFELHAGDIAEVKLLRADKGGAYLVDGYDENENPKVFTYPRGEYEMTILTTTRSGTPDTRTFRIIPKRNGAVDIEFTPPGSDSQLA